MFAFIAFPIKRLGADQRTYVSVYRKILYRPFFCIADNCMEWQCVDRSQRHSISRQLPIHCSCLLIIKLAGYKPSLVAVGGPISFCHRRCR